MKLAHVHIRNFRSCRNVRINVGNLHALVGANNAGKSSVLRSLDFFFNPSSRQIDEETFWNKDSSLKIRVECLFTDLTPHESDTLAPYLRPDGSFLVAREAALIEEPGEEGAPVEKKTGITQQYSKPVPTVDWLNEAKINGTAIAEWWKDRDALVLNGQNFAEYVGGARPGVGDWKEKAREFAAEYLEPDHYEETWIDNPRGYAGVLKASLPFFVLVPAVRDVAEESKVSKTNPFGRLVYAVMDAVTAERKNELEALLAGVARQLNRGEGNERIEGIRNMEQKLNESIRQIFAECDLEIEFQTPTFEVLMTSPRIYVDDGFRTLIDNKGHGLQRAAIFSILRSYAEFVTAVNPENKRTLILAVEEPELYMHPLAQRTIRKVFTEMANGGDHVLFSTHSALMVDVSCFDEIIRTEGIIAEDAGQKTVTTRVWQLPAQVLVDDEVARHPALAGRVSVASIREHYSNAYNPTRNEGFFARRIVLVEGQTEEYALPIYAEAIGNPLDALGVAVVECGGKSSMDRHFRVFNELGIPCYILMDYDRNSDKPEITAKSRELLELMGAASDPPSGYAVYDRIACFEENWEATIRAAIPDYDALRAEAAEHLGPAGKPLVARYIAHRIASEGPAAVPDPIREILTAALAVAWNGSCLAA